jgi:hypothetical protein
MTPAGERASTPRRPTPRILPPADPTDPTDPTDRGETVARAKRTDRAEARRRFRQNQLEEAAAPNELTSDGAAAVAVAVAARPAASRRGPTPASRPAQRPGVLTAFRLAAAPADVRGDLRLLPSLLLSRGAIIPGILILASLVVTFALGATGGLIPALMFQAFLAPPPMAASFLAGILTDRAAWLLGLIAGIAAGVGFALVMVFAPDDVILGLYRASSAIPAGFRESYAMQALLISPLMGLATGAFAGFYRRFLRMAGPQQPSGNRSGKQRKAGARR